MAEDLQTARVGQPLTASPWVSVAKILRWASRGMGLLQMFLPERHGEKDKIRDHSAGICILASAGVYNLGDNAIAKADILWLQANAPEAPLTVFCSQPDRASEEYNRVEFHKDLEELSWVCRSRAKHKLLGIIYIANLLISALCGRYGIRLRMWKAGRLFLDHLRSSRALLGTGGGYLNSFSRDQLVRRAVQFLAARIVGTPVVLSGITLGPLCTGLDRRLALIGLSTVRLATLRDAGVSTRRAEEIGARFVRLEGNWSEAIRSQLESCTGPQARTRKTFLVEAADDAMKLPSPDERRRTEILELLVPREWLQKPFGLIVGLNLKASLRMFKRLDSIDPELEREIRLMACVANYLIERYDAKLLFIPTDVDPVWGDDRFHRKVAEMVADRSKVHLVSGIRSEDDVRTLLAHCDIAIGCRFHFCVFAALEGVPFLGMASGEYQMMKLKGLSDLCGVAGCWCPCDIEHATLEDVRPWIDRLVLDSEQTRQKLRTVAPSLAAKSAIALEYLRTLL